MTPIHSQKHTRTHTHTFRLLNLSMVERSDLSTSLNSVSYFSLTLLTRESAVLSSSSRDAVVSSSNRVMTSSISYTEKTNFAVEPLLCIFIS